MADGKTENHLRLPTFTFHLAAALRHQRQLNILDALGGGWMRDADEENASILMAVHNVVMGSCRRGCRSE